MQHESMISHLRNQLRPDPVKDKQVEQEKKDLKEKLNSLSIRINGVENITEFLRQD